MLISDQNQSSVFEILVFKQIPQNNATHSVLEYRSTHTDTHFMAKCEYTYINFYSNYVCMFASSICLASCYVYEYPVG